MKNEYTSDLLELRSKGELNGVFALCDFPVGAVIWQMWGDILPEPDKYSLQIDEGVHLGSATIGARHSIDDDICHACDPSARIDFSDLTIRARRRIKKGDEITINYCATEEEFANPFQCECGSSKCYGYVRGFKYLSYEQQSDLLDQASPYIRKKYKFK